MLIVGGNQSAGGYNVDNSCRFNQASQDYLNKTFSSDTNRTTYTISTWVKRSSVADETFIIAADTSAGGGNTRDFVRIESNDQLRYTIGGGAAADVKTTQVLRDVSAWYHIIVAVDTTQATSSNRVKIYINGNQVTDFATSSYPSQNHVGDFNDNILHRVGMDTNNTSNGWNGYMSEFVFIDGQQLDPTDLGEFDEDSGIWKPIDVSGLTFGTNGFYFNFGNSSALGEDSSGNGNNFTVNNLTSIDQSTDTCTTNFSTLNPLIYSSISKTYSDGNLSILNSDSGNWGATQNNIGVSSGKWYMEIKITSLSSFFAVGVGFNPLDANGTNVTAFINSTYLVGEDSGTYGWRNNGALPQGGTSISTYTTNDILMIALDMDNLKVYFGKNGSWENSGDPTSGATGTGSMGNLTAGEDYFFIVTPRNASASVNFGSPPYSISSGNTDGNGYGNFEYAVPSSYYSLNTKNLAEYG